MPLTGQARAFLDEVASKGSPPSYTITPQEARLNRDVPLEPGPDVGTVVDHVVSYGGADIPVRVYTPRGAGPHPVLVWFHGGGWVIGSLLSADGTCRRISAGTECAVVSVDYRLAPEWKFPTAVEDCYASTCWVADNASALNIDPGRIAVGGDSCGGTLATVMTMLSKERKGPPLVFQLLICPLADWNFETTSYRERSEGTRLTVRHMRWYKSHYLRDEADATHPYAAPLHARDVSGLPPALVITAEYDPLCDEGEAYAEKLKRAGVATTVRRYDGVPHLYYMVPGRIDEAKTTISQCCEALRKAFAKRGTRK